MTRIDGLQDLNPDTVVAFSSVSVLEMILSSQLKPTQDELDRLLPLDKSHRSQPLFLRCVQRYDPMNNYISDSITSVATKLQFYTVAVSRKDTMRQV